MKLHERCTQADEDQAQHQRTENAEEEHPVLVFRRDRKAREDQRERDSDRQPDDCLPEADHPSFLVKNPKIQREHAQNQGPKQAVQLPILGERE